MIVDTSALVAIVVGEADAPRLLHALSAADVRRVSAASLLEASIALARFGEPRMQRDLDLVIAGFDVRVEPFTERQVDLARDAWRDYGRGSGHAAKLNYGDCMTYAVAIDFDEPLLFVGRDFAHTDVVPALA